MSFVTINAEFKLLIPIMERIARVLERFLLESYRVRLGHCAETMPDPNPKNPVSVDYASDEQLAREKLIDLMQVAKRGPGRDGDGEESAVEQDRDALDV